MGNGCYYCDGHGCDDCLGGEGCYYCDGHGCDDCSYEQRYYDTFGTMPLNKLDNKPLHKKGNKIKTPDWIYDKYKQGAPNSETDVSLPEGKEE